MKRMSYYLFRFIKFLIRVFYPKTEIKGAENIPEGQTVVPYPNISRKDYPSNKAVNKMFDSNGLSESSGRV